MALLLLNENESVGYHITLSLIEAYASGQEAALAHLTIARRHSATAVSASLMCAMPWRAAAGNESSCKGTAAPVSM